MPYATTTLAEPSREESAALEALKKKTTDRTYPTIPLARHLQNHLDAYGVSKARLVEQLELKEFVFFQWLRTLQWPQPVQALLEDRVLSSREIQTLSALNDPVLQLQVATEAKEIPPGGLYKRCNELSKEKSAASGGALKRVKSTENQSEKLEPSEDSSGADELKSL